MTNDLQPGQHLSPDQLSAFAENVLPEHERIAALTHLSTCVDCRQVVFLTQQADPAPTAALVAESPRRSWLSLPQIFVAASAALACTIVLALIIHHQLGQPTSQPPVTTAKLQPPTQLPQSPASQSPAPAAPPTLSKATAAPLPATDKHLSTTAPSSLAESRSMSAAPAPQAPAKIAPQKIVSPPPTPTLGGIIAYSGTGSGQAQESKMTAQQAYVAGANQSDSAVDSLQPKTSLAAHSSAMPKSVPMAAAPPPAPMQNASSETVTVDAATVESLPLAARNTTNYATLAPGVVPPIKLPGKKPIASQLSSGNRSLALDTAGALFLSTDNGKHWRAIAPQWSGKAVQLAFAPSPARAYINQPQPNQTQIISNQSTGVIINGTESQNAAPQQQTVIPTAGFQLTTATGAIWLSTDGLNWHPR